MVFGTKTRVLGLTLLAVLTVLAAAQQVASALPNQRRHMNQYVLIFRQRPGQLSEADLAERGKLVTAWAQKEMAAGRQLDPRILDSEREVVGEAEEAAPTALLFIDAKDMAEAVSVAKAHPGVKFGASVEVRAWTSPLAAK